MITVLAQALSVLVLVASVVLVVADVRTGGLTSYEERGAEPAEEVPAYENYPPRPSWLDSAVHGRGLR